MFDIQLEGEVTAVAVKEEVQNLIKVEPADPEVEKVAEQIFTFAKNFDFIEGDLNTIENIGKEVNSLVASKSKILDRQIKGFQENAGEASPVAKNLELLEKTLMQVNPSDVDFDKVSVLGKFLKSFNPIKKYFEKFQTFSGVLDKITHELTEGKKQLMQDNVTMQEDTKNLIKATFALQKQINVISRARKLITEYSLTCDETRKNDIEEHIIYTLAKKESDMETLKNVAMQAAMAMNILIRNNKELITQTDNIENITMFAFKNAIAIASALANQKLVLKTGQAIQETTNKLIADSANKLKVQGAEIHKMASSAAVDVQVLKQAFSDMKTAIDEVSTFRINAIPQLEGVIGEFKQMSKDAEKVLASSVALTSK